MNFIPFGMMGVPYPFPIMPSRAGAGLLLLAREKRQQEEEEEEEEESQLGSMARP